MTTAPIDALDWWNSLRHSGLLVDRKRLAELYAGKNFVVSPEIAERLRETVELGHARSKGAASELVDFVLEEVCGFQDGWKKGSKIDASWTRRDREGLALRPDRLWQGLNGALLPVFIDKDSKTLGLGRGRRFISRVVRWMRSGSEKVAVVTNGRQWRVLHAGLEYEAWCESDSELWFEDGYPSRQLIGLGALLSPSVWIPDKKGERYPLLRAIEETRKGQADLSSSLGERVRIAVENLIDAHKEALDEHAEDIPPAEVYRAAVRIIMRIVVVLFAEARGLLPIDNAIYHTSYGLRGLHDQLRRLRRTQRIADSRSAWPRLLALFRLVHDGSSHPDLSVMSYGGELFQPGDEKSGDALQRAIGIFENSCFKDDAHSVPDTVIESILEHLTRTTERIRSGRGTMAVPVPVDFSDLSSEYIGVLYEGLLDYELKQVPEGEAVIILPAGNRPALALSRLEAMDDSKLGELIAKFAKDAKSKDSGQEDESEEDEEETEEEIDDEQEEPLAADVTEQTEEPEEQASTSDADLGRRVTAFLQRLVEKGKLVPKPRGKAPEKIEAYKREIERKSLSLARDVHYPGKRYLVRWGGTRKGSGTFYTRPGLSGPLIHRTLAPLAYIAPRNENGSENRDLPLSEWIPRKPEEILDLKVCDAACGSGTFPVGALRFLTQALWDALSYHKRIAPDADNRTLVALFGESGAKDRIGDEFLPCPPDDETYEPRLRSLLKRHVAERCIYAVDLDPLAVELCRLAIWIETLDPELPFSFLDHKIKCGNALVGCWFDRFGYYPAMAFLRDTGDSSHSTSIHHPEGSNQKILDRTFKERVLPDLEDTISGQQSLFDTSSRPSARTVHDAIKRKLEELHFLPAYASSERARRYQALLADPEFVELKAAFDLWCALWFWPVNEIDQAPLASSFLTPTSEAKRAAAEIARRHRFFHWEIEFPDVFSNQNAGFDAIIGNPPWDISKPNSREYFSNIDPLFRLYGKQEALNAQRELFRHKADLEEEWLVYNESFKNFGHWVRNAGFPFGERSTTQANERGFSFGRGKDSLHDAWMASRIAHSGDVTANASHPYQYQGSGDTNLYKCFLEQSAALLQEKGRLGVIVQSGIHTDKGTQPLRSLLLNSFSWEWCFGFTNRRHIFPGVGVRFDIVIAQKGEATTAVRCAFMKQDVGAWVIGEAENSSALYEKRQIELYSQFNNSLMELRGLQDRLWLDKVYDSNNKLIGANANHGWEVTYRTEFHLTNDSSLFARRTWWESEGYVSDEYGRWIKGNWSSQLEGSVQECISSADGRQSLNPNDVSTATATLRRRLPGSRKSQVSDVEHPAVSVPLYQGAMLWHFDFRYRSDIAESGKARWAPTSDSVGFPIGFYLIPLDFLPKGTRPRIGFREIGNNTMRRSLAPALLPPFPHSNKVPTLNNGRGSKFAFLACLASFVADAALRLKISEATINWFSIQEIPLPPVNSPYWTPAFDRFVLGLCGQSPWFANEWLETVPNRLKQIHSWKSWWASTFAERQRRRAVIDAVVARAYGLDLDDVLWLLRDCFHASEHYSNNQVRAALDQKGFWRVDRDLPPPIRHTTLFLAAFESLGRQIETGAGIEQAVDQFVGHTPGSGWPLPAEAAALFRERGEDTDPPTKPQTAEASWREVEMHRNNLYDTTIWTGALTRDATSNEQSSETV